MPDILNDFPIAADVARVFHAITTPEGLDAWWTVRASGAPRDGAEYELWFGPEYDWRARVTRCVDNAGFELLITSADADWTGTRVSFQLEQRPSGTTWVRFAHLGWPEANEHFRVSSHCWALYLRILRRWLEHGAVVAYDDRLRD